MPFATELFFPNAGYALSWGVTIAGLVQLVFVWICARRAGITILPTKPVISPEIRRLFKLMVPGIIGAGVVQINLFADVIIASFLPEGAVSHLYYADRLNQLPLGTVGIAIGTALLPMLSKAVSAEDPVEIERLFNRGLEACFVLALPAALALGLAAEPIILTLFQRGAFTVADAGVTASVLTGYSIGLPAYVAGKVFATACYARQDTKTPVIVACISVVFNIVVALFAVFALGMGVAGIALATGLAGWVQIGILWKILHGRRHLSFDDRFKFVMPRVVAASLLMALVVALCMYGFENYFADSGFKRLLALAILVGSGGCVYLAIIFASKAITMQDLRSYFRKTPKQADIK
jgi:putative peptidoglycan lipid II flippase